MSEVGLREVVNCDDDRRFEVTVTSRRGRVVEVWTMQAATQLMKNEWVTRIKKILMKQFFSLRRTHVYTVTQPDSKLFIRLSFQTTINLYSLQVLCCR